MNLRGVFIVLFLAGMSTIMATTPEPEEPRVDLRAGLTGYVYWMDRVSRIFHRQAVETMNMHAIEEEGSEVHDILLGAILREEKDLNITLNRRRLSKSLLKSLEKHMKNLKTDTVIGLVLADSIISGQGARMVVAHRLFEKMTEKMQESVLEFEHSERFLKRIFKQMSTAEIALDTMVSSFKLAEQIALGKLSHHRSKRQVCTGPPSGPRVGGTNLGGGFSTDGSSVMFNHGQTTVTATPHFNIFPKPEFHGGNVAFEHQFDRIPGSISGHVTVNQQGQVQNAGLQIKIDL